jgi:hypothetical protein
MATEGYDDYGSFASDPTDLEKEMSEIFGRYFQTGLHLGTGIFTGGLGQAYAPGFLGLVKFVYYYDKSWATEMGTGYANNRALYTEVKTDIPSFNLSLSASWVPVFFGFRYGFNPDELARGFSMMNPYLSAQAEIIFRSEKVLGEPILGNTGLTDEQLTFYNVGGSKNSNAVGLNLGGGIEFDVYKNKVFFGIDLRYHVTLWNDRGTPIGFLERNGNIFTISGVATYNY